MELQPPAAVCFGGLFGLRWGMGRWVCVYVCACMCAHTHRLVLACVKWHGSLCALGGVLVFFPSLGSRRLGVFRSPLPLLISQRPEERVLCRGRDAGRRRTRLRGGVGCLVGWRRPLPLLGSVPLGLLL